MSWHESQITKLKKSQDGLVSLIVTVIIITVLSLVTLAFSDIMRKEQSQALQRQVSTQAYYAAESGINDTIKDFKAGVAMPTDGNTCRTLSSPTAGNLDPSNPTDSSTGYKCVFVNKDPDNLEFSTVTTDQSVLTKIQSTDGVDIDKLLVSWQSESGTAGFRTGATTLLPTIASWGGNTTGMVRISIYPIPPAGAVRTTLNSLARTYFLYPGDNTYPNNNKIDYKNDADGLIQTDDCSTNNGPVNGPYKCNVYINFPLGGGPGSMAGYSYFVRIKAIYNNISVNLSAYDNPSNQLRLSGAQVSFDATGATADSKRRVNVRLSQISQYNWPEFAIETTDNICKLLLTAPGPVANPTAGNTTSAAAECPLP
jgi:type II secretory pathway pseudopilin PulG